MSNETIPDPDLHFVRACLNSNEQDSRVWPALDRIAARLRAEAAQDEQQAVAFGHVYRVVVDENHASAHAPWDKSRGVVFETGPARQEGVHGCIQYLNLYTRPQPVAVAGDAVRALQEHRETLACAPEVYGATIPALDAAIAAPAAPAPSFGVIETVCSALTRFGVAVPESKEEQAARADELIAELCRIAAPAPVAGDAVAKVREITFLAGSIVRNLEKFDGPWSGLLDDALLWASQIEKNAAALRALAQDRASQEVGHAG